MSTQRTRTSATRKRPVAKQQASIPRFEPGRLLRNVPLAAWMCALVACLNAVSWSFITPPFESPDENDHFAYIKQLAETGTLPASGAETYSQEETFALGALHAGQIRLHPATPAIFSTTEQEAIEKGLEAFSSSSEKGSPAAGVAQAEPPLYYALASIPYELGSSGTLLDRLQLVRLYSALLGGLTALFAYLFLREALPRTRWTWTIGALGVALTPMLGFMSGSVNPDAMLFAVSAALFYCVARAFRRGLETRSAIAFGGVIAAGLVTKINFAGLAPGAFLALGILALRQRRSGAGRDALKPPAIAAAIGCLPILLYMITNALGGRPVLGIAAHALDSTRGSIAEDANYIWQFYLPHLPGTVNNFAGVFTPRQIWFKGFVGLFGWLDTTFPTWVYTAALIPAGVIVALAARELIAERQALRARVAELMVYAVMVLGLMILVGTAGYQTYRVQPAAWGQARYLLPTVVLLGAVLALAARGAGRRWGPSVGAAIVILFLAHDVFSQLQTVARFYG